MEPNDVEVIPITRLRRVVDNVLPTKVDGNSVERDRVDPVMDEKVALWLEIDDVVHVDTMNVLPYKLDTRMAFPDIVLVKRVSPWTVEQLSVFTSTERTFVVVEIDNKSDFKISNDVFKKADVE